jgi:hypothetical protein
MALMSFADYARYRNVSRMAVTKWVQSGRISSVYKDGKRWIDSTIADSEWEKTSQHDARQTFADEAPRETEPSPVPAQGAEKVDLAGVPSHNLTKARAIKEGYNARISKLAYEERVGQLVEKEQVEKDAFTISRRVRDQLMSIPIAFRPSWRRRRINLEYMLG